MKTGDPVMWNGAIWTIIVEMDETCVHLERDGFEVLVDRDDIDAIH